MTILASISIFFTQTPIRNFPNTKIVILYFFISSRFISSRIHAANAQDRLNKASTLVHEKVSNISTLDWPIQPASSKVSHKKIWVHLHYQSCSSFGQVTYIILQEDRQVG